MSRSSVTSAQAGQFVIVPARFDDPRVVELVHALYLEQRATYSAADSPLDAPADYLPPAGIFLLAVRDDHVAIGCGGYRAWGDAGTAEVRKMFARPEARGQGVGAAILAELEHRARVAGRSRLILETGAQNAAALALYQRFGFEPIPSYVPGREASVNRAFAKTLAGSSRDPLLK